MPERCTVVRARNAWHDGASGNYGNGDLSQLRRWRYCDTVLDIVLTEDVDNRVSAAVPARACRRIIRRHWLQVESWIECIKFFG